MNSAVSFHLLIRLTMTVHLSQPMAEIELLELQVPCRLEVYPELLLLIFDESDQNDNDDTDHSIIEPERIQVPSSDVFLLEPTVHHNDSSSQTLDHQPQISFPWHVNHASQSVFPGDTTPLAQHCVVSEDPGMTWDDDAITVHLVMNPWCCEVRVYRQIKLWQYGCEWILPSLS